VAPRAAHDSLDASNQFSFVEWLGHVVVGAITEALDLVLDEGNAGKDENRCLDFGYPQGSQHLKARYVRKVQIEQDES